MNQDESLKHLIFTPCDIWFDSPKTSIRIWVIANPTEPFHQCTWIFNPIKQEWEEQLYPYNPKTLNTQLSIILHYQSSIIPRYLLVPWRWGPDVKLGSLNITQCKQDQIMWLEWIQGESKWLSSFDEGTSKKCLHQSVDKHMHTSQYSLTPYTLPYWRVNP